VVRSRVEDYKTLFMGVSLEMIADVAVQKEIMKLTYDWFSGLLSNEEFDSKMLAISANYPNPANQYTMIPIHGQKKGQVEIYDLGGKIIQKLSYAKGTKELKLNTSDMQDGLYVYKIVEDGKIVKSLLFQIIH
jgi:myo-inositol-hexaphosphate 3-phosphohydrolase